MIFLLWRWAHVSCPVLANRWRHMLLNVSWRESLCLVLLLAGSVMFVILLCHTYGSPPPSPRSCPSLHSLFHFSSSSHQPSSSYNAAESFSSVRTDLLHGNHAHKSPSSTRLAASDNEFTSTKLAANLLLLFSLYVGLLYHRGNWRLQAGVLGEKWKNIMVNSQDTRRAAGSRWTSSHHSALWTSFLCLACVASYYLSTVWQTSDVR